MNLFGCAQRIGSRFACATPEDASPAHKRHSALGPKAAKERPHCQIDVVVGTTGTYVERVAWGAYDGHVPDAAVLLANGIDYRAAARTTQGLRKVPALAAACVLGAGVGCVLCGAGALVLAALAAVAPSAFAPPSWAGLWAIGAPFAAACGAVGGFVHNAMWRHAHRQLSMLHSMSEVAERFVRNDATAYQAAWCRGVLAQYRLGEDWLLDQAAMELQGLQRAHEAQAGRAKGLADAA